MVSANTPAQMPSGSVIPPLSGAQLGSRAAFATLPPALSCRAVSVADRSPLVPHAPTKAASAKATTPHPRSPRLAVRITFSLRIGLGDFSKLWTGIMCCAHAIATAISRNPGLLRHDIDGSLVRLGIIQLSVLEGRSSVHDSTARDDGCGVVSAAATSLAAG